VHPIPNTVTRNNSAGEINTKSKISNITGVIITRRNKAGEIIAGEISNITGNITRRNKAGKIIAGEIKTKNKKAILLVK
jgi:hypothetical protein